MKSKLYWKGDIYISKKHTYEYIKEQIEKVGYRLLSEEYINSKIKLEFECPKGHKFEKTWNYWQQGQRCSVCSNRKLTLEYVKEQIEKEGYRLLSKEYKNAHTKMELECPEGHRYPVKYGNFKQGQRCSKCYRNKLRYTYDFIKSKIEENGYKLLSKEYKGANYKIEIKCPKGHNYEVVWSNWQQGNRCSKCAGVKKLTYEEVKKGIEKEGYKLLSEEYKNNKTRLELECPKGYKFKMTWNDFMRGVRCPQCDKEKKSSKGQKEVLEYIQSLTDTTIIENDRSQILNPRTSHFLELDIYLPELKKAIEYNGTYWHSSKHQKYKDNQKVIQCEEKGIDLLVVEEYKWINNNEGVKNEINKFI